MYLIVGLGNPEKDYSNTRHNMGFNTINKLANQYKIEVTKSKFKGLYGSGIIEGEKVILLKPQTFMNSSGESIKEIIQFYKIEMEQLIIIYDDIDIEPGIIKLRKAGGPGTHNGMKSVVDELNTQNFKRVRVGIGMPNEKANLIEYVIGAIPDEDKEKLDKGTDLAKDAVIEIIKNGIDIAMNKFN
jgi:PTH1 family peptidyl-tRNA hydrolase